MKQLYKVFLSSIGAGLIIAIGGFVFLTYKDKNLFLAALLFSIGLLTIISFKKHLFTGKCAYIFENKPRFLVELFVCWIGNFVGAVTGGYLFRLVRIDNIDVCKELVTIKLNDNPLSILILSMMCGFMIYVAVEMQKKDVPGAIKLAGVILPILVFIVAGFEHCVANMFYFSYANAWGLKAFGYILLFSLGNVIGSLILWALNKYSTNKD